MLALMFQGTHALPPGATPAALHVPFTHPAVTHMGMPDCKHAGVSQVDSARAQERGEQLSAKRGKGA